MEMPKAFARGETPKAPPESFHYNSAGDQHIQVTVESVLTKGDHGFQPSNPNWLQARVTVRNVGREPLMFVDMKEKLADSTVLPMAVAATDVQKFPSAAKTMLQTGGIQAAGMAAGFLLFPAAGLVVGAASALPLLGTMRSGDRMQSIQDGMLQPQQVAPDSQVAGNVFLPAVTGQKALVVSYMVGGSTRYVTLQREQ
jgi:hypothetical protein